MAKLIQDQTLGTPKGNIHLRFLAFPKSRFAMWRSRPRRGRALLPVKSWPVCEKKTRRERAPGLERRQTKNRSGYFCHVRFLWRFAFKRFRRLCLFIFRRRFFFRLPMLFEFREGVTVRPGWRPVKPILVLARLHHAPTGFYPHPIPRLSSLRRVFAGQAGLGKTVRRFC
jgi:hypothetical protein